MALTQEDIRIASRELDRVPRKHNREIQALLNVEERTRTSLFPWKGQFSPQLVQFLLTAHASSHDRVLDPFCGSGTVLAECAAKGLPCTGFDINPGAFLFSAMHGFCNLSQAERNEAIGEAQNALRSFTMDGLFAPPAEVVISVYDRVRELRGPSLLLASAALMIAAGDEKALPLGRLSRALSTVCDTVIGMPFASARISASPCDSRYSNLPKESKDLVITSPPYINVFNYHQNYRPVLESLGWVPLRSATAEIGANRKHRQNRFRTVVQYGIDMALSLREMQRTLVSGGRIVMIVGRSSVVRRVSYPNARMLALIAGAGLGLTLEESQERKFMNRYGEIIYEDILVIRPRSLLECEDVVTSVGRSIGAWALEQSLIYAEAEVKSEIISALNIACEIKGSPRTEVVAPEHFFHFINANEVARS